MIGSRGILSPELRYFLEQERTIPEQPDVVRARAMTRARAAVVAGLATPSAPSRARLWGVRATSVMLASLACATGGVAAYGFHSKLTQVAGESSRPSAGPPVVANADTPAALAQMRFE